MHLRILASLFGLAFGLVLSGCTTPPTEQEVQAADYGPPPTGKTADIVRSFMALRLKDPDSAQYKFPETIERAWLKGGALSGRGMLYGWRADVMINAKNSYGGYTGYQHHAFIIRDGRVVAYNAVPGQKLNTWQAVE